MSDNNGNPQTPAPGATPQRLDITVQGQPGAVPGGAVPNAAPSTSDYFDKHALASKLGVKPDDIPNKPPHWHASAWAQHQTYKIRAQMAEAKVETLQQQASEAETLRKQVATMQTRHAQDQVMWGQEAFRKPAMQRAARRAYQDYVEDTTATGATADDFGKWFSEQAPSDPLLAPHFQTGAPPPPPQAPDVAMWTNPSQQNQPQAPKAPAPPPVLPPTGPTSVRTTTGPTVKWTPSYVQQLTAQGLYKQGRLDPKTGKASGGSPAWRAHMESWAARGGSMFES